MINILYIHNDNQQLYNPLIDANLINNLLITKFNSKINFYKQIIIFIVSDIIGYFYLHGHSW